MKPTLCMDFGGGCGAAPADHNCGGGVQFLQTSKGQFLTMSGTAHIAMRLDMEFEKSIRVKDTCFEYGPDSSSLSSVLKDIFRMSLSLVTH